MTKPKAKKPTRKPVKKCQCKGKWIGDKYHSYVCEYCENKRKKSKNFSKSIISSPETIKAQKEYNITMHDLLMHEFKKSEEDTKFTTGEQYLLTGIMQFLSEGVQKTEGPYSYKNNRCKHERYGYEGCDSCTEEHFEEVLARYRRIKENESA